MATTAPATAPDAARRLLPAVRGVDARVDVAAGSLVEWVVEVVGVGSVVLVRVDVGGVLAGGGDPFDVAPLDVEAARPPTAPGAVVAAET